MIKVFCEDKPKYIKLLKTGKTVWETLGQKEKLVAELIFVSEEEIKQLNKDNRNIDRVTDVLSFPNLPIKKGEIVKKSNYPLEFDKDYKGVFIGSVVICSSVAEKQAKQIEQEKARKSEKTKNSEKEINKLLSFKKKHSYA